MSGLKIFLGSMLVYSTSVLPFSIFYGVNVPWNKSNPASIDTRIDHKAELMVLLAKASKNSGKYAKAYGLFEALARTLVNTKSRNDVGIGYFRRHFQKFDGKPANQARAISEEFYDKATKANIPLNCEKWRRTWVKKKSSWVPFKDKLRQMNNTIDWIFNEK